jgi:hypothetical protein
MSFDIVSMRKRSTSTDIGGWANVEEEEDGEVAVAEGDIAERLRETKVLMQFDA